MEIFIKSDKSLVYLQNHNKVTATMQSIGRITCLMQYREGQACKLVIRIAPLLWYLQYYRKSVTS